MNRTFVSWVAVAAVCAGTWSLSGCSRPSAKLVPVSGKVTLDGQPLTSGQVSLYPTSRENTPEATAGLSTGNIDANGNYKIFTAGKEGAPTGEYKFLVTPTTVPDPDSKSGPPSYFQVYGNPQTSPFKIQVVENPPPGRYDLKLEK